MTPEQWQIVAITAGALYGLGAVGMWAVLALLGMAGKALARGQTRWSWGGVGLAFWMGLFWPITLWRAARD